MEGLAGGVAVAGYMGDRCSRGSCGPGPHRRCQGQSCSQHGAPRQGPSAGRQASCPPSSLCSGPCLSNFGFPDMLPRRSVQLAWLPPFHLGEQEALEMGGLPFPEWKRCVCAKSKLWS